MPDAVKMYSDLEAAEGAQCIWPQHLPQASLQPDNSSLRHGLGSDLSSMQQEKQLTDFTLSVSGSDEKWEVHKVVLASSSPFFKELCLYSNYGTPGRQLILCASA